MFWLKDSGNTTPTTKDLPVERATGGSFTMNLFKQKKKPSKEKSRSKAGKAEKY